MIELILFVIGAILTIKMINAAFRLGQRNVVASEAAALSLTVLVAALSPDARARADETLARVRAESAAPPPAKPRTHNGAARF
jgi:hypothetical protein